MRSFTNYKDKVQTLRAEGMTYKEINSLLDVVIPKSTLALWCKEVKLSEDQKKRIRDINNSNLASGRAQQKLMQLRRREIRDEEFLVNNLLVQKRYDDDMPAQKLALALLYIAEGSKRGGSITFGNSDPQIIKIFLHLLRTVYSTDEQKFRVTVQCRADQDIEELSNYWQVITGISRNQFYKPQIDKRTIGKPTKKSGYKGVCRINYLSAAVDHELQFVAKMLENR